ncbi:MAG: protein-tyrosine phosphatase [Arenicella sp.]|jgi:protein-tyrosine phosphatase
MKKVLFVCMGNICRSPTAHGVMQHKVTSQGLNKRISVDSAGTHAYHVGQKSDPRSRAIASAKGIDMESIRARKISLQNHHAFDYILAMDQENLDLINSYSTVRGNAPATATAEVRLFLDFANRAGLTSETQVPDPYYGGDSGFDHVFELVDLGCDALIEHILRA